MEDFKATLRAWGDQWQGQVTRRSFASRWCVDNGYNQTMNFRIATYGDNAALVMCNTWAMRMQQLLNAFRAGRLDSEAGLRQVVAEMDEHP